MIYSKNLCITNKALDLLTMPLPLILAMPLPVAAALSIKGKGIVSKSRVVVPRYDTLSISALTKVQPQAPNIQLTCYNPTPKIHPNSSDSLQLLSHLHHSISESFLCENFSAVSRTIQTGRHLNPPPTLVAELFAQLINNIYLLNELNFSNSAFISFDGQSSRM